MFCWIGGCAWLALAETMIENWFATALSAKREPIDPHVTGFAWALMQGK
jgi:hypothetical protein